jgi:putative endonuclease
MAQWFLYICQKGDRFYVGITTDLKNRMRQHGNPDLLYSEGPLIKVEAVQRERQIKGWRREKKIKLMANWPGKPSELALLRCVQDKFRK